MRAEGDGAEGERGAAGRDLHGGDVGAVVRRRGRLLVFSRGDVGDVPFQTYRQSGTSSSWIGM